MNQNSNMNEKISFVIQGPVTSSTSLVITNIRKYFPNSEIVLSTWVGSDLSGVETGCDKIVLNEDPGATVFDFKDNKTNNLNRIIVSSLNGIKAAKNTKVVRLRSDILIINDNINKIVSGLCDNRSDQKLFEKKIVACDTFSLKLDYRRFRQMRLLFHVSDWIYIGCRSDLEELFTIPLVSEPGYSQYFIYYNKSNKDIFPSRLWNMSPEQYITSTNARKQFGEKIFFPDYTRFNDQDVLLSMKFIVDNFNILSLNELGVINLKNEYRNIFMKRDFPPSYYYSELDRQIDYDDLHTKLNNHKIFIANKYSVMPLLHRTYHSLKGDKKTLKTFLVFFTCLILYPFESIYLNCLRLFNSLKRFPFGQR